MQKQSPRKTDRGKCSLRSNKRVYRRHAGTDRRIYVSPRKLPWGHLRRGPRRQQRAHTTAPCTTGPSSPLPGASPHPLRSNFPLVAFCHGPQPCYKTPLTSRGTRLWVCYPKGSRTLGRLSCAEASEGLVLLFHLGIYGASEPAAQNSRAS